MPAHPLAQTRQCTLPWRVIRITGADVDDFLNGQLTARVPPPDSADCRLAGHCHPNGRLLALLWLWRVDGVLHAALPADNAEATVQRLQLFRLRSDVQFEPLDDAPVGVLDAAPAHTPGGSGLRVALPEPGPAPGDEGTWTAACIAAGIASIRAATREQAIPQMIGLEQLGGLDFRKGCYPGQEIVARLHYKGSLKQRLYRLTLDGLAAQPGQALAADDGSDTGLVLDAAADQALVLARVAHAGQTVVLAGGGALKLPDTAVYPDAR